MIFRNKIELIRGGEKKTLPVDKKNTILTILRAENPEYLSAPCGGMGTCGKCTVRVTGKVRSMGTGEILRLEEEEILACRYLPAGSCRITLAEKRTEQVLSLPEGGISGGGEGLGIAVDIGSTTVAAQLYDLTTGQLLAEEKAANVQRAYGADVLSRLQHSKAKGHGELSRCLQRQLRDMAERLLKKGRNAPLKRAVLCGNTIMEHYAVGLDPSSIAVPPFSPASLLGEERKAGEVLLRISPCLSGYVGGDVISGLAAAAKGDGLCLYMDIGTNGEIALGEGGSWLCCATAAGPAFEGAELSCGMAAAEGAIHKIWADDGDIALSVIGGGEAAGICGSGVIDAVAVMLELGVIRRNGRFEKPGALPEKLGKRLISVENRPAFLLSPGVYLSLEDVRNVQLAKAAICAGAETLLARCGKKAEDISSLIIAGGFGTYINVENALRIGLLPAVSPRIVRSAGNAALLGAARALTDTGWRQQLEMQRRCSYADLSTDPEFSGHYLANMNFAVETGQK